MRVLLMGLCLMAVSGCFFDGAVPTEVRLACRTDDECPDGQVCSVLLGGLCAPTASGDNDLPSATSLTVTPAVASVGVPVVITMAVSELLGADPVASVDVGDGIKRPLGLVGGRAADGDLDFDFTYMPLGDEQQGPRPVVVGLVDRLGTVGQAVTELRFDFDAPSLSGPAEVTPTTTNDLIQVALRFSDGADAVTVSMRPADGGDARLFTADDETLTSFSLSVADGIAEGPWIVSATASDVAGNQMEPIDIGAVTVDRTAPSTNTTEVFPSRVRRGDLVRITVQAVEALADDDVDIATLLRFNPPLPADAIAAIAAATLREVVIRINDDAPDGDYAVSFGPLRDIAGNVLAEVMVGSVHVDGTAPGIAVVDVVGEPLNAEGVLEVTIVLDEPVMEQPRLTLGDTALVPLRRDGIGPAAIWAFSLNGATVAMDQVVEVVVDATDDLGNRAAAIRTGMDVDVDTIAPRVVAAATSAETAAVQGTTVFVFTVMSEAVVRPPTLVWSAPSLPFAAASEASAQSYTFVAPVRFDSPDGQVELLRVENTTDLAGNPVVQELPGLSLTLRPRECLVGSHFGDVAVDGRARCVDQASCSPNNHFGGAVASDRTVGRECLPDGACSADFHDGGAGTCVLTGTCSFGHHAGGLVADGVAECVDDNVCSDGFHYGSPPGLGVASVCVPEAECSPDNSFGGAILPAPIGPQCVARFTCSTLFHNGGDGQCVLLDRCSPEFHDDDGRLPGFGVGETPLAPDGRRIAGTAECIPMRSCAFGFQLGQNPDVCDSDDSCTCVRAGTCAEPNHPGRPLEVQQVRDPLGGLVDLDFATCVAPRSACAAGFHDDDGQLIGGVAQCVASTECRVGFQIGQEPLACVADDSCTCVAMGQCATGFHPGGPVRPGDEAQCVPDNVCLDGARSDGHGICIGFTDVCARGFHEGGAGLCLPRGQCADDFTSDGTGACRSSRDSCATGYRDDGSGTCLDHDEPCAPGFHDDGGGVASPGVCVDNNRGCANAELHDGGDKNCVASGECSPGFFLQEKNCVARLACDQNQHDGGDGATCTSIGSCLAGYALFGSFCRPQAPTLRPGVFDNACDPEAAGRIGSDGLPLRLAIDGASVATAATLECRMGVPDAIHDVAFGACDDLTADQRVIAFDPGQYRVEVRATVGGVRSQTMRHTFAMHESLDGAQCCSSTVSDARWLAAARDSLPASPGPFGELSSTEKPYIFVDAGQTELDALSLRHRFTMSDDHRLLLVTRSAASSFAERSLGQNNVCSGVRVRLGTSSSAHCPKTEEWFLPFHGRKPDRTARLSCKEVADGCRRFRYDIVTNGVARRLFEREDCGDARSPYELFDAEVKQCEAYVVDADGNAACLASTANGDAILVDVQDGGRADLGTRILNNHGRFRAFSGVTKQGL